MNTKLFNKKHESSHVQPQQTVAQISGVCSGATWQEEGGSREEVRVWVGVGLGGQRQGMRLCFLNNLQSNLPNH